MPAEQGGVQKMSATQMLKETVPWLGDLLTDGTRIGSVLIRDHHTWRPHESVLRPTLTHYSNREWCRSA
jgi:hypothetical protein